jgi:hypothetical protein
MRRLVYDIFLWFTHLLLLLSSLLSPGLGVCHTSLQVSDRGHLPIR